MNKDAALILLAVLVVVNIGFTTYVWSQRIQTDQSALNDLRSQVSGLSNQVASLNTNVATLSSQFSSLSGQVSSLSSAVETLSSTVDQQADQINRLKIPDIVKKKLTVPNILVDQMAGSFISEVKSKAGSWAFVVDGAAAAIKTLISSKLTLPSVELTSATRISGNTYNANLIMIFPIRLAEIPLLSTIQNIIGDITVRIGVELTAQIDTLTEIVSNVQYTGVTIA